MTQLLAWHGDPSIKAHYLARVRAHAATDAFTLLALAEGWISADVATGKIFGSRWGANAQRGALNQAGYIVLTVHGFGTRKQLKAHRVVWLAAGRDIPSGFVIDHINRVKHDNRLCNLRLADAVLNARNRRSYAREANPAAKLTTNGVSALRCSRLHIGATATARKFGVSKSLVYQIARGDLW